MNSIGQSTKDAVLQTEVAQSIKSGSLKIGAYRRYMADVYCYAKHSSQVIATAGSRLVLSHPKLADYLLEHSREELGHDQWAKQDLRELGLKEKDIHQISPSDACQIMITIEYYYAHHANAVGLFGWMLALEGLGGAIGGAIAKGIDACLSLGGKGTYFLSGHGEADSHHSADLLEVTAAHITTPEDREVVMRVGQLSQWCYVKILENCVSDPLYEQLDRP